VYNPRGSACGSCPARGHPTERRCFPTRPFRAETQRNRLRQTLSSARLAPPAGHGRQTERQGSAGILCSCALTGAPMASTKCWGRVAAEEIGSPGETKAFSRARDTCKRLDSDRLAQVPVIGNYRVRGGSLRRLKNNCAPPISSASGWLSIDIGSMADCQDFDPTRGISKDRPVIPNPQAITALPLARQRFNIAGPG